MTDAPKGIPTDLGCFKGNVKLSGADGGAGGGAEEVFVEKAGGGEAGNIFGDVTRGAARGRMKPTDVGTFRQPLPPLASTKREKEDEQRLQQVLESR